MNRPLTMPPSGMDASSSAACTCWSGVYSGSDGQAGIVSLEGSGPQALIDSSRSPRTAIFCTLNFLLHDDGVGDDLDFGLGLASLEALFTNTVDVRNDPKHQAADGQENG